jgi:cell division protein FtsB
MRGKGTLLLLLGAVITTCISIFGGDNLSRLSSLESSLSVQRQKNEELGRYVQGLRQEVHALKTDERALEKAARNQLGMARPDEVVVIFDEQGE